MAVLSAIAIALAAVPVAGADNGHGEQVTPPPAASEHDGHSGHEMPPAASTSPQGSSTADSGTRRRESTAPSDRPAQERHGIHDDAHGQPEDRSDATPGGQGHDAAGTPVERPRTLVLGVFMGVNALVLAVAAHIRRRARIGDTAQPSTTT